MLSELKGKGVELHGFWEDLLEGPAVALGVKRSAANTFENLKDATWLAAENGIETGMLVFEKSVGSSSLFQITEVGHVVKVQSFTVGSASSTTAELPLEVMVKQWQVFKGEPPQMLPATWMDRRWLETKMAREESARAKLFLYIQSVAKKHGDAHDMVSLLVRPTCVVAAKNIKKGDLVLVPTVPLKDIVAKSDAGDAACEVDGVALHLNRPAQPTTADDTAWKNDAFVAPYFWVGYTEDESECNVHFAEAKAAKHTIPTITNFMTVAKDRTHKVVATLTVFSGLMYVASLLKP